MNDVYKVTKVIVKLGGKEVEMTTEDAHKLRDSLNELFGNAVQVIATNYPVYIPSNHPPSVFPWQDRTIYGSPYQVI